MKESQEWESKAHAEYDQLSRNISAVEKVSLALPLLIFDTIG